MGCRHRCKPSVTLGKLRTGGYSNPFGLQNCGDIYTVYDKRSSDGQSLEMSRSFLASLALSLSSSFCFFCPTSLIGKVTRMNLGLPRASYMTGVRGVLCQSHPSSLVGDSSVFCTGIPLRPTSRR